MKVYTVKVDKHGIVRYYNKAGQLHRLDGPAVQYPNGDKYWYRNDKLHREDGPAVEWVNGSQFWYKHDEFHRKDGPAMIIKSVVGGHESYWINGREYKKAEFDKKTKNLRR